MANTDWKCADCGESFEHERALRWHQEKSSSCRMTRAVKRAKLLSELEKARAEAGHLEEESFPPLDYSDNDGFIFLEEDNPPRETTPPPSPPRPPQPADEDHAGEPPPPAWDSTRQVVYWLKKNGISGPATNEFLRLMRDQRLDMDEVLDNLKSNRDVKKVLMKSIVGEVSTSSS